MRTPPTEIEFYKRENSRLYLDIERRNIDNAKLREENFSFKETQKENQNIIEKYEWLKSSELVLSKRILDLESALGKLRKGHSVAAGCNKPLNGICNCDANEQNLKIDSVLVQQGNSK